MKTHLLLSALLVLLCGVLNAQLNITPDSGCNCFNFSFQPTPTAIQWNFGDGQFSNAISPTYCYGNVGTYTVTALINGVATTDAVSVEDCCGGLMTLAAEDQCCFDLTFVNDQDQLFTGINLGLETGPRIISGFGTGPDWAPIVPAGPNDLQLGYIGGPHIPVAATGGVRICLDGDTQTSGPTELYTHWMVGPDTVCIDTIKLECELCEPVGKTYITSMDGYEPILNFSSPDEFGYDAMILDASEGEILYAGIGDPLIPTSGNSQRGIRCGRLDSCGNQLDLMMHGQYPLGTVNYIWRDVVLVDARSTGFSNSNGPLTALKVGTVDRGNGDWDIGIASLYGNSSLSPFAAVYNVPERQEVKAALLENGKLYVAGTVHDASGNRRAFIYQLGLNNPGNSYAEFAMDNQTTAEDLALSPNGNLLFVGRHGNEVQITEVTTNGLNLVGANRFDVDGDLTTAESGMTVTVDGNGRIMILGNIRTPNPPIIFDNHRVFLLRIDLGMNSIGDCALSPDVLKIYDFSNGYEYVTKAVINGEKLAFTGLALGSDVLPGNAVPSDRVYLATADLDGNIESLNYYNDGHLVEDLIALDNGYVLTGTELTVEPNCPPLSNCNYFSDIWMARTDQNGIVADCECFTELGHTSITPPTNSVCEPVVVFGALPTLISSDFAGVTLDSLQSFCGQACGDGGPGIPCPSNCCGYISGFKYEDKDMNGQQDLPFDSEICGWTIELIDDVTGAVLQTTTTNQAGFYAFTGLCAGSYRVREQLQNCWVQSAAPAGPIDIGPNQWQYYRQDFGNWLEINCGNLTASINDLIPGQSQCEYSLEIDNNVCPDIKLVQLRSGTPGVDINALGYQSGVTDYLPRPNTNSTINATGGNNNAVLGTVPSGNGVGIVNFSLSSICDPEPNSPFMLIVDYFVDLPCSLSDAYCSDTIFVECPLCPPECEVATVATPTADTTDLCCYDLTFNIGAINQDEFTSIEIRPIGGAQLTPLTALAGQYSPVQNTTSIIELISNTGSICPGTTLRYFPTGSLPSVEVCVTDFASSNPQITIDYVKCSGDVCPDTLTLPCNPCIEIVQDTTYCDGEQAKYEFTIRNTWDRPITRLAVNGIQPSQLGFSPDTLFFPAPGIPVGGTVGPLTICLDNISHPDTAKFTFTALGDDDCCFCISDLICAPVPFCCDTCESIDYMIRDTVFGDDSICCYSLDVYHCVPDTFFTAIRVNALGGVTINQQSAGSGWAIRTPLFSSNVSQTFFPQPTPIHGAPIPDGWSNGKINFCIGGVNDPSQIPQQIELEWLAGNDSNVVCVDTLQFECTPLTPDSNCVALVDTAFECVTPGTYTLDLDLEIKRPGLTYGAWVQQFSSVPSGAIVTTDPTSLQGIWTTGTIISMPTITVSNVNPGDSICFVLALADTIIAGTNTNYCCYSDTICLVVPPCPISGGYDCDTLGLPAYEHDYMGWAVATCFSGFNGTTVNNNGFVVGFEDVRNTNAATPGENWNVPNQHFTGMTAANIGQVFGVAVDEGGCVYLTATTVYGDGLILTGFQWGSAGSGGVYRFCPDASGNYTLSGSATLPNTGSGLGNVTYDPFNQVIYVSNFMDGLIYQLDANTMVVTGNTYDFPGINPSPLPTALPGFVDVGQRVWAVEFNPFDHRLYFGVWGEDMRNEGPGASNEIWSLAIDNAGNFLPTTARYETELPARLGTTEATMPISDLAFAKSGHMIAVERTMKSDKGSALRPHPLNAAHSSRCYRFNWSGTNWVNPQHYYVGNYSANTNAAGGGDFGYTDNLQNCDSLIWVSGDALRYNNQNPTPGDPYVYGLAGIPFSGNSLVPASSDYVKTSSLYVDLDGITGTGSVKYQIGDVEIFRDPCCTPLIEPACCDDIDGLTQAVDSGWVCTISPNGDSLTIDNPDFGDCVSIAIDWGDGSPIQTVPASQLPVSHPYATNDPWEWCAFVTATDDDGMLCFEGQHCKLVSEVADLSNEALKLKLYPNPSRATLWLSIEAPRTERLTLEIFDSRGRKVMSTVREVFPGEQQLLIEPGNLPGGYYLLRVQGVDFVATEKFVRLP